MKRLTLLVTPLMAASFLASCNKGSVDSKRWYEYEDWWNYCSNGEEGVEASEADIGQEVEVKLKSKQGDEVIHKVRLIDINHDDLVGGSGKAHTTWEFINTISSSGGYLRTIAWENKDGADSKNYGYSHSLLNKFLNGNEEGDISKSVLGMLPQDLTNAIQLVEKKVGETTDNNNTYIAISYQTKLFPLSKIEIGLGSSYTTPNEGSIYQYYKDHRGFTYLQKFQVNEEQYNDYWLRSPSTQEEHDEMAWAVNYEGGPQEFNVYYCSESGNTGTAPAFCI